MEEPESAPRLLKLVAASFILLGSIAVVGWVFGFIQQQVQLNPVVVDLFIGFGLLYRRRVWRTVAFLTLTLTVLLGLAQAFFLLSPQDRGLGLGLSPFAATPGQALGLPLAILGLQLTIAAWQFWALTRRQVVEALTSHA